MNQIPRQNPDHQPPPLARNAAAMLALRAELTDGQRREVNETLAGYRDPVVLTALAAGIGGAITAAGVIASECTHSLWRRPVAGGGGEWEHRADGTGDVLSSAARRWRGVPAPDGAVCDYLVLPIGEKPPEQEMPDTQVEAETGRDIRNHLGGLS